MLQSVLIVGISYNEDLHAQIPSGYYSLAEGKTGNELKIALHNITKGHSALSYSEVWSAYNSTDKKPGTNKIWDIYSDNPGGTTSYEFTYSFDQCSGSSPSSEGVCYNREHIWPQSLFSGNMPMYADLWIVYPTDALVNSKRSNYPFGEVSSHTWISSNSSRLGTNTYPGAPSTLCFEPNDSFKGDIARSYFYIAVRYYSQDATWDTWEMSSGADLKGWAKKMLLDWHNSDPVSQKEKDRNNEIYSIQNNRNPFIDYPEFADCIFGTGDCSLLLSAESLEEPSSLETYPNPSNDIVHFKLSKPTMIHRFTVYDFLGREVESIRLDTQDNTLFSFSVQNMISGLYYFVIQSENHTSYSGKFLIKH